MSVWLSEINDESQDFEELNLDHGQHKPTAKPKQPGFFDGSLTAPYRGVSAGFIKTVNVMTPVIQEVSDRVSYTWMDLHGNRPDQNYRDWHGDRLDQTNKLVIEGLEKIQEKDTTGTLGQIGFSLGDYGFRGVVGGAVGGLPGAAAVTAIPEYDYVKKNLINQGVDEETATKVGLIDAGIAGVSTVLPLSYGIKGTGGLAKDALLSIGGNAAIMNAGRYASGEVLENQGYEKQAKQYEITGESVATDIALSALLFGAGRYAQSRQITSVDDAEINNIQSRQDAIQDTLAINERTFDDIAPTPIQSPIEANKHYQNTKAAMQQVSSGQPVNPPHKLPNNLKGNAKLIADQAKQNNIDPSVALTISHIETGGLFNADAQNPNTSAHGLFQVVNKTWKGLGGKDRGSVSEQIRIGLKHIQVANAHIAKKINRPPQGSEQYLGHLLGPEGAVQVIKADANTPLIDVVKKYDAKNADAIVKNNGMSGLTAGQAREKWRQKWNQLSSRYGGADKNFSTAYGMDGSAYDFQYEVRPLADLIASNDAAFGVNPAYPAELQPRDRSRVASQQQINDMANNLRPELLGESYKLSDGAPIIGFDNVVESGNGRTLAIGKAYDAGRGAEYEAMVRDVAQRLGLDATNVQSPVLVRRRLTDVDRVQFTRLANESDVAQMSATERAKTDADKLPDAGLLKINNDGSINIDGSMDYVRQFVSSLPKAEQANLITSDGRLSQDGKRRIESAIMRKSYADDSLITRLSENLDDDSKNVLNALLRNAPKLTQLADLVAQGGRHANTIAQDAAQAAQKFSDLKANGLKIDDYLNQGQLIDDGLSTGAKDILAAMGQNSRSAKAIGDYIDNKIAEIENMGDPRQGSLFGDDAEGIAAMQAINDNPDQMIAVKRTMEDGTEIETEIPLHQMMSELDAEAKQAELDNIAAQTAITCALQFGE